MFGITDPGNIHIHGSVREDRPEYIIALDPGTDGIGTAALDCSSLRPVQYGGNPCLCTRLLHDRGDAKERRAIKDLSAAYDRKRRRKRELSEILDGGMIITPPQLIPLWREKGKSQELTMHLTVGILRNPEMRIPPEVLGTVLWQYTQRRGYTYFKGEAVAESQEEILEQLEPVLKKFGIEIRKSSVSDLRELTMRENFSADDLSRVLEKVFIDSQNAAPECRSAIVKLLCGQLLDAGLIWPGLKDRNIRIDLRSALFVHERDTVADELPDTAKELCSQLLNLLHRLYCRITLEPVMQGCRYISEVRVMIYERHKENLQLLKRLSLLLTPEESYKLLQAPDEPGNYAAYVGHCKCHHLKKPVQKKCTRADFCSYVRKNVLETLKSRETVLSNDIKVLEERLQAGDFLPVCRGDFNRRIPRQVLMAELEQILAIAGKQYPFLNESGKWNGLTASEAIVKLCAYSRPFYCGPVRKTARNTTYVLNDGINPDTVITSYNIDAVVNPVKTAEKFVLSRTAKCTYLPNEPVLPAGSPLYESAVLLSSLNSLRINGRALEVPHKQALFRALRKEKKASRTKLVKLLNRIMGAELREEDLSGVPDILPAMPMLSRIEDITGTCEDGFSDDGYKKGLAEEIAGAVSLYHSMPEILYEVLKGYPSIRSRVCELCRLDSPGWGRMSERFLTGITPSGKKQSILDHMWETGDNLQQTLALPEYREALKRSQPEQDFTPGIVKYADIREKCPPGIRRSVHEHLRVVAEFVNGIGYAPSYIVIESTRTLNHGGAESTSRKKALLMAYDALMKDSGVDETERLRQLRTEICGCEEEKLRNRRLYLYYQQEGIDMYTGEPITLKNGYPDPELYDIDHVIPRCRLLDNGMDNIVLTSRNQNAEKSDRYPLDEAIRKRMAGFWNRLYTHGLLPAEKRDRLMRAAALTDSELSGFIARQLVEAGQIAKALKFFLERLFPTAAVFCVSPELVSTLRRYAAALKNRYNDLHHGIDAYLTGVAGFVYAARFLKRPWNDSFDTSEPYNLSRLFEKNVRRGNSLLWTGGENGSIAVVRSVAEECRVSYRYGIESAFKELKSGFSAFFCHFRVKNLPRLTGLRQRMIPPIDLLR